MANALAYGFVSLANLMGNRVTKIGERVVLDAISQSAAEHSKALNGMLSTLVQPVTKGKDLIPQPGSGEMQPLDALGNPLPVPPADKVEVAYPLSGHGTAWATNRVSRAYMTAQDANQLTLDALAKDTRTIRRHLLASILDNVAWTYYDEAQNLGNITIQPLANADTRKYLFTGGSDPATDTHYLAQAAAISDDANPFPTIHTELSEHPGNGNEVVVYVPTNLTSTIKALANFVPVKDEYIIPAATTAQLPTADALARVRGAGDYVLGRVDECWIVEWKALPSSYMLAHAINAGPVVGMRQYDEAALQGLFIENNSPDGNIMETRMIRYAGFGVMNRQAALCYRIGNGSYAIPSGYDAPLAI